MGVTVDLEGFVATVTLRWPEQRNALGPDEAREVTAALGSAVEQGAQVVVLTGEGAFCAGGNLRGMVARADMPPEERRRLVYGAYQGLLRALVDLPVPTLAALDGPAVGMGFDLALACDVRLVGPDGWVRQGWGAIGAVPGTGGVLLLRLRAPGALWRILPGQPKLPAAALAELGLAESTGDRTAVEVAQERARQLAEIPPHTLAAYVELDRAHLRSELPAHLEHVLDVQVRMLSDRGFKDRAQQALQKP
jgi:enoyl-CoA hydratase/carnithine racemase